MAEEARGRCPVCGAEAFRWASVLYEAPYFGHVLISMGSCGACGYRYFDVEYADVGRPTRVVFKAENGDDVSKSLIVRSKTGSIKSPDLGFSLEPGPQAEPFITTVEGALYKALDYAERMKVLEPESAQKVDEFMAKIVKAIDEGGFTLVVEDPLGKSLIIPHRPGTINIEYLDGASQP